MRYLLSSILLILCFSCASYPKKNGFTATNSKKATITNPYFSNTAKDYVYKANIDAFGTTFGGIFIVKKLGQNHHRIVFTTEIGNKIFDFTFKGEDFKVNHILKKLDKKILINVLKNDFKVLIKEKLLVEKGFQQDLNSIYKTQISNKNYYHFVSEEKLHKVVRINNRKEKVVFTFSEIENNIANEIQISHQNINLKILLKAL